jgi:hypothetical protein
MVAGTNEMITMRRLRKIPIIRGKDGREIAPLLWIKTFKGLKREKVLPLLYGTYL